MDHHALVIGLLKGMTQAALAEELHVTQPTVNRWLRGADPRGKHRDAIVELARERGLIADADILGFPQKANDNTDANYVDEVDLTAGLGGGGLSVVGSTSNRNGYTFAREVVRDHWRLPDWMLAQLNVKARHLAAFPAQGDSMSPTINNGDVVFIDTRHRVPSPPGVYALADEFGGVVIKRLEVVSLPSDDDVTVDVISDNPKHNTKRLSLNEINIIGRYIGRFTF